MNRDELLAALRSIEWTDIEFKKASSNVPKSALSTVSAFANTQGGHLVFGVTESGTTFSVTGVAEADVVQNAFLGQLRDTKKISAILDVKTDMHALPEGTVLAFFIPEAPREKKPVYIDGNPKNAYIRRGSRDEACLGDELLRFIRDAATDRYDAQPLDLDPERCFDTASVRWYRSLFASSNPGKNGTDDDPTFLRNWGFLAEQSGKLLPTRAGILVLGADEYVRQILPRMVVDLQLYRGTSQDYSPSVRWADRVTVEENLVKAWQAIVGFYFKHSDRPFSVDASTLRRDDDPADYVSFRESAINLLIHQDFGDTTRVPVIRLFRNETEFFNPGDAFASREQLLDPGDKEVRNPSVVRAFRRIGLSDQAGSGIGAIFDSSRRLGYLPPQIENKKAEKSFRLRLCKERLITEAQLLAQASLGVQLTEPQAAVFAYLTRQGEVDLTDIKALTGLSGPAAVALARYLTVQVLMEPPTDGGTKYRLAPHLRERFRLDSCEKSNINQTLDDSSRVDLSTEQVVQKVEDNATEQVKALVQLTEVQWTIVGYADAPRSFAELMAHAGYSQRPHFKAHHLEPLLAGGVLRMTVPEKPRSSQQRYVLTEMGLKLKAWRAQQSPPHTEQI